MAPSDIEPRGCILELFDYSTDFQEPWSFEDYPSFRAARARIDELWQAHRAKYPGAGMMVHLRNSWGNLMYLGINEQGWLILLKQPSGILCLYSTREDDGGHVIFPMGNFEETEYFPKCFVHSEANAEKAVADWVMKNSMYLQLPESYRCPRTTFG